MVTALLARACCSSEEVDITVGSQSLSAYELDVNGTGPSVVVVRSCFTEHATVDGQFNERRCDGYSSVLPTWDHRLGFRNGNAED